MNLNLVQKSRKRILKQGYVAIRNCLEIEVLQTFQSRENCSWESESTAAFKERLCSQYGICIWIWLLVVNIYVFKLSIDNNEELYHARPVEMQKEENYNSAFSTL